uniref:T6SS effector BTH_I2691 family protein n=2 Tax=Variovorax sp. S12S4 TaxID=3029170 RepID=UPI0031587144
MAMELSLHHLTAATPYVDWLKATDDKGISNQWKQAASESVRTMRLALAHKAVEAYDDATDRLRDTKEALSGSYPGSDSHQPVKLRRADGTYEEVSIAELNRRRAAELDTRIGARESDRSVLGSQAASADALARIAGYCDVGAVAAFDALHKTELGKRDELMDKLAIDLHAWLKADALTERALGRYSDKAGIDSGDGARCAGQLCAILLQIDSAPKGRQWYAALDPFTPGSKNLVWRMLSLNNAEISTELHAALELLTVPLPPAGLEVHNAEENARQQKSYATVLAALGQLGKTLGASDKINKGLPKVLDSGLKRLERLQAGGELAKVVYDSPHAVLGAAAMARFKALPAARAESFIAKAQLMLLARGLGQQAMAFTRNQQANALTKATAKQARYTQRRIEKAIQSQIAETAGKDMRLPNVLLGLNALAILPALANANTRRDERTTTELMGTMAGLVGSMRQWRADLYEKALFKQLPDAVYKTHKAGMTKATQAELLAMKAGAAHFVVAGAVVGVAWDAMDAVTASKEQENWLSRAYMARAATGGATIFGAIVGASYLEAPLWLVRFNFVTAIAAGALTIAIGKLKGDAWANWLQAQPFHQANSGKMPHKSEKETMSKLANALAEIE